MSSKALLDKDTSPTEEEVKQALAENHGRCGSHYLVVKAVMEAAGNTEVA